MKRWLCPAIAAAVAIASGGSALAADLMPTKAMPMKAPYVAPPPLYNWTGFYIGGHVGGGWASTDVSVFNAAGVNDFNGTFSSSGWLGGGQAGFNWMLASSWVLGFEADISGADINGSITGCSATGCSTGNSKVDELGTARGRLGYAMNNWLFYGTGGFAWGHSSTTRTIISAPGFPVLVGQASTASGTDDGWVAGAGIEWGFMPNWTARVEYLHYEFDNIGQSFTYSLAAAARTTTANTGIDTVRFGLNYLWNWSPAPLIARY